VYRGYLKNDQKHGPGTYVWKDRSIYNGEFFNDKAEGYGEL
jgi:hypothetical protein